MTYAYGPAEALWIIATVAVLPPAMLGIESTLRFSPGSAERIRIEYTSREVNVAWEGLQSEWAAALAESLASGEGPHARAYEAARREQAARR